MIEETFTQTELFRWGVLPLMIAISRITDVTIGTLRHIFIAKSPVKIIFTVIERKNVNDVGALINQYNPGAFYSVEDIRMAKQGVFPGMHAATGEGKFNYFRRIFPSGKMK